MTAHDQRRIPMETRRLTSLRRLRFQITQLARTHVEAMNHAILIISVKRVVIARVEHDIKSVCARERHPIAIPNTLFAPGGARSDPIGVVL